MNLYVWNHDKFEWYCIMAVVIANTVEEARRLATERMTTLVKAQRAYNEAWIRER